MQYHNDALMNIGDLNDLIVIDSNFRGNFFVGFKGLASIKMPFYTLNRTVVVIGNW